MSTPPTETLLSLYRTMVRIRLFEERVCELYPEQQMRTPVHLYIGQEAVAAGVCENLGKDDYLFSNHRSHGHTLAKGASMKAVMAELYLKRTGCSKGKGGSMHLVDVEHGILGTSAIVAGGIPMAVGAALASKMRGERRVSVAFFGDGAVDEGVFYESLNFAALKRLPVVFVCENNLYATNSRIEARHPTCRIASAATAMHVPGHCVDGNDAVEVYMTAMAAVNTARRGHGPTLIEARTYRWKGHVGPETDFEKGCRPEDELREWMKRCPVKALRIRIASGDPTLRHTMRDIEAAAKREIDEAVSFAKASPDPDPSELTEDLYCGG
ncbi:MAG TPA: thiamine pyrophosphate-dependent dehydrogenase E1 component subunit alpha [Deltaproteobacteria bacterium]|nr:thiamine pyrophosphate-dependent dehydrogenase E1 component subunit alpha [Deltaproteobacteria bacterium]